MLAVQGNDGTDAQIPPAYETGYKPLQSKKNGIRRIRFQDTDDNSTDAEAVDYSVSDVSAKMPRSLSSGAWGDELSTIIAEINAVRKTVPKFYATYCTAETVSTLSDVLGRIDAEVSGDANIETLSGLKTQLEAALNAVNFKHDSKIAQIYVATDKGNGDSYGTSLAKSHGYVPAQLVVVGTDGNIIAQDLTGSGQIEVRGNSTSGYAKRPYNMKFSSKFDIFGFGKSKKWCLLADYLDPTLMRNKIALDLSEILGLEPTMAHKHVEVYVDGSYRGMYLLTEKIEEDKNRVNINTKNGDFLLETVVTGENEAGNIYFTAASGQKFRLREPEPDTQEEITAAVSAVKAKVDNFENVISSGSWENIAANLDVDSFVSYYVLNEYMKTYDIGWPKSVYFHCKGGKYYAGPGWDFDFSSGNTSGSTSASDLFMDSKIYYRYLVRHSQFQQKVSEKISQISARLSTMSSNVDEEITFYADAIARNNAAWPLSPIKRASWNRTVDSTYEANTSFLKSWLNSRYSWMTDYFLNRVYLSSEAFPDANFLAYVKTLDSNNNGFLDTSELRAITSINVSGKNIASLQGIEHFTSLASLNITGNPSITALDISGFPLLFLRNITHDPQTVINTGAVPRFSGHSMLLSGKIGLDFYMNIPQKLITDNDYMQFTINGQAMTPSMLSNADSLGNDRYRFTCFINSIQMADEITAEFHCGDGNTYSQIYRAKDYTDAALAQFPATSPDIRALICAIKDYGHYVQPLLAENNGWTLGTDHKIMDCSNTDILSDSADVKSKLRDYSVSFDAKGSGISSVEYSLSLESETELNIWLRTKTEYQGSVYARLGTSNENMAVVQPDGTYCVKISGISAHKLGDIYTVHVSAGGDFDIKVSALSYADIAMRSNAASLNLKKAVIALYKYYVATMNYRASDEYNPE